MDTTRTGSGRTGPTRRRPEVRIFRQRRRVPTRLISGIAIGLSQHRELGVWRQVDGESRDDVSSKALDENSSEAYDSGTFSAADGV
jgi:hypothetical protein